METARAVRCLLLGSVLLLFAACDSAQSSDPAGRLLGPADSIPAEHPTSAVGSIWISPSEIRSLPTSGPAWDAVLSAAREELPAPNLNDQDERVPVLALARALVWSRVGGDSLYWSVVATLSALPGTEGDNALARSRHLGTYVLAADVIGFRPDWWLNYVRFACYEFSGGGRTVVDVHERRPNNWGTHAGASRLACALFLGEEVDVSRAALVFRGWCGERDRYSGFEFGALDWQADPDNPVPVNPRDAIRDGFLVDGALPEEMRRGGGLQFPPASTGYVWEALQGAAMQAYLLDRAGYSDVERWGGFALWRALQFLKTLDDRYPADGWNPDGDDESQVWIWRRLYGAGVQWKAVQGCRPGKNFAWTDWTLGSGVPSDVFPSLDPESLAVSSSLPSIRSGSAP